MRDTSEKYVKKEDNKGEVADGKESDLYVVKDKMEKDLNNEREDKISIKKLDKNIEEKYQMECDDMQNKKKTKVDTKTDYKDVASTSENMKMVQPHDLTTAPKENETKTVSFKTPEIIIFTEEMEKTIDISKSDTTQSDLNEGEDDTCEVDEESDDEIPCSQIIRSPCGGQNLLK